MKDNRENSTRKNIRFDNELLAKIESKLCGKPFGTWVQETCTKAVHTTSDVVHTTEENGTHQPEKKAKIKNTYAAANGLPSIITEELHKEIMELSNQGLSGPKIEDIVKISKATINRVIKISKEKLMLSQP